MRMHSMPVVICSPTSALNRRDNADARKKKIRVERTRKRRIAGGIRHNGLDWMPGPNSARMKARRTLQIYVAQGGIDCAENLSKMDNGSERVYLDANSGMIDAWPDAGSEAKEAAKMPQKERSMCR